LIKPFSRGFAGKSQTYGDFDYKDALNLESLLTPEEIQIRDMTRAYCQVSLMHRLTNHFIFDINRKCCNLVCSWQVETKP